MKSNASVASVDRGDAGVAILGAIGTASIATVAAAGLDFAFGLIYWGMRGVDAGRVLQAIASWIVGYTPTFSPGVAALALVVQVALYAPGVAALMLWVRNHPRALARWPVTGALWGALAYLITFQLVVPIIADPVSPNRSFLWVGSCLLVHLALIGPATAWIVWRRHRPRPAVASHSRSGDRRR